MSDPDLASRLKSVSTPIPSSFHLALLHASHILHHHAIVDSFGHISARSPRDPSQFLLGRNLAPSLYASASDLVTYSVATGEAVPAPTKTDAEDGGSDSSIPRGYLERYIHAAIYAAYPHVQSVVHAHSEALLPYGTVEGLKLRPVLHMGAGTGVEAPVWDVSEAYGRDSTAKRDLLVRDLKLGQSLANKFAETKGGGYLGMVGGVVKGLVSGAAGKGGSDYPVHELVLMRGHGFTAVGRSVEEVVFKAVYAVVNARAQTQSLLLGGALAAGAAAQRVTRVKGDEDGGYTGDKGEVGTVKYLDEQEVHDAWGSISGQVARPWAAWVEEVRRSGNYRNELDDAYVT